MVAMEVEGADTTTEVVDMAIVVVVVMEDSREGE